MQYLSQALDCSLLYGDLRCCSCNLLGPLLHSRGPSPYCTYKQWDCCGSHLSHPIQVFHQFLIMLALLMLLLLDPSLRIAILITAAFLCSMVTIATSGWLVNTCSSIWSHRILPLQLSTFTLYSEEMFLYSILSVFIMFNNQKGVCCAVRKVPDLNWYVEPHLERISRSMGLQLHTST